MTRHLPRPLQQHLRPMCSVLHCRMRRGFTLIEMLVVMTLIATLLTLAVPRYFSALESGRLRVQAQNLATLRDAIDKFFADQGRYPEALEELVSKHYLRQIPVDPVTETTAWLVLPPADTSEGRVYDVQPNPVTPVATMPPVNSADLSALPEQK